MNWRALLLAALPVAAFAQGSATQIYVTATKTSFIWGEAVKVTATVLDAQGVQRTQDPIAWSVTPSAAASVAADGSVTARQLVNFVVQAQTANLRAQVLMQAVPKRIAVTPQSDTMTVGATQKITASALDLNDRPIPGAPLAWLLDNLNANNPFAEIDSSGNFHALVAGRVRIGAHLAYDFNPWLLWQMDGDAYITIEAPHTYKLERVFLSAPSGRDSSILGAQLSALVPTDNGFDFVASLDGIGSALVEWTPDGVTPVAVSGRAHASTGQPLIQITGFARNHNGNFLCAESDAGGRGEISAGTAGDLEPLLVPNTPVNGADQTDFALERNSVADSGMKVFSVTFTDTVTRARAYGLLRGTDRGLSDVVFNSIDGLPGGPPAGPAGYFGIADDGTVWFTEIVGAPGSTKTVLFRSSYGGNVQQILRDGDSLAGFDLSNLSSYTLNPYENRFFAASNGDLVLGADTTKGGAFLRWTAVNGSTTPDVLQAPANGVFWYEPGVGALIDTRYGNTGKGLYLWNQSSVSPVLLLGDASLDGTPVQEIFSASANSKGVIYAMIRTDASPMLIVRLAPDKQIVLKSGDSIAVASIPLIGAMAPGAYSGVPLVIVGGQTGGIARIGSDGSSIQPIIRVGDALLSGKGFAGSAETYDRPQVRALSDGRIIFGDLFGVYVWNSGKIDVLLPYPVPNAGSPVYYTLWGYTVNSKGDVAANFSASQIYYIHNSIAQHIMGGADQIAGASVIHDSVPILDDSGRVAFSIRKGLSDYYVVLWDGTSTNLILGSGQVMSDGRSVRLVGGLSGINGMLVAGVYLSDGSGTYLQFLNNAWEYGISKGERLATGSLVSSVGTPDVNSAGDVVFYAYGTAAFDNEIAVKRGNTFHSIHSMGDRTPNGELLIGITQLMIEDDGTVFLLAVNDQGQQVIYRASPLQ